MTNNKNSTNNNTDSTSPMPVTARIGIAVVAIGVIAFLLWQVFANRSDNNASNTNEAENTSVATAVSTEAESIFSGNETPQELFELGNNHYQNQEWEQSIAAYKKAIELDPNFDVAYANLGAVYYAQQELDLAAETYQKAIELAPDDADLVYNLGAIYLQQALATGEADQAKLNQAVVQINKAINLNPNLAEPYYGLGVVNQQLGNKEEAIGAFETFLRLDDGFDSVATQNAQANLQQLKSE